MKVVLFLLTGLCEDASVRRRASICTLHIDGAYLFGRQKSVETLEVEDVYYNVLLLLIDLYQLLNV